MAFVLLISIGQVAGEQNLFALSGLFLTAVLLPFAALCLMLFYNGDYNQFFSKIGVWPGKIVAFATLALIGPFGVVPRCIAFSYSTFSIYFDCISLIQYSAIACALVFLLSIKKSGVVGIIGNLLTPLLLISLAIIIYRGLTAEEIPLIAKQQISNFEMFRLGFVEGYKTFDIFAALFFATAIIPAFRSVLGEGMESNRTSMSKLAFRSSLVGMAFLFLVYAGLSFVSANLRGGLIDVPGDKLLGMISTITMGNTAGVLANAIVSLACLTTAISLAVVSAEFFKREVFLDRISYGQSLLVVMVITFGMSSLGFSGIMRLILPILMIMCPAVITLIIANGLNYFYGFKYIKAPVYCVFIISLMWTMFL